MFASARRSLPDLLAPAVAAHDAADTVVSSTGFQPVSSQSGQGIGDSIEVTVDATVYQRTRRLAFDF